MFRERHAQVERYAPDDDGGQQQMLEAGPVRSEVAAMKAISMRPLHRSVVGIPALALGPKVDTRYFATGLTASFGAWGQSYNWDVIVLRADNGADQDVTGTYNIAHIQKGAGVFSGGCLNGTNSETETGFCKTAWRVCREMREQFPGAVSMARIPKNAGSFS